MKTTANNRRENPKGYTKTKNTATTTILSSIYVIIVIVISIC
nr:hypothetical protein [uncultured Flavobacterium sp.]